MVMVGITEQLEKSARLLTHLTGMKDLRKIAPWHASTSAEAPYVPSEEEMKEMRYSLRYDYELYEYAKKKFEREYEKAFPSIV